MFFHAGFKLEFVIAYVFVSQSYGSSFQGSVQESEAGERADRWENRESRRVCRFRRQEGHFGEILNGWILAILQRSDFGGGSDEPDIPGI